MYLKRLKITGFKSFANKTVLNLEPGMTAVVGPNGSGKSNIADAIRWALGEQSKGRLRLGDREEVVFAGSDGKARASMADVTLVFNNDGGSFPLNLTEIEISRRLYRSGETEYRLAGRLVKLADLQQLLAEAGFGVGSYAVIGQGTIDSLLLSSPSERKLLFDEAAGIRGPELSRAASLKKLALTEANLVRLRDIVRELTPQLTAFEQSTSAQSQEQKLSQRITSLRASIISTAQIELSAQLVALNQQIAQSERASHRLRHDLASARHKQAVQLKSAAFAKIALSENIRKTREVEQKRDTILNELASVRTTLDDAQNLAEQKEGYTHEITALETKILELSTAQAEIADELATSDAAGKRSFQAIQAASLLVTQAQSELVEIRQQLTDGAHSAFVSHALSLVKAMARELDTRTPDPETMRLLIHKTGRLLSHASKSGEVELAGQLKTAQLKLEAAMNKRETATEHQTNVTLSRRSIELEEMRLTTQRLDTELLLKELIAKRSSIQANEQKTDTLKVSVHKLEAMQITLTRNLERLRLHSERTLSIPAAMIARVAVELDRWQTALASEDMSLTEARRAVKQVLSQIDSYDTLSHRWDTQGPKERSELSLSAQEELLSRLEAELSTRQEVSQDLLREQAAITTRQRELITQIADLEAAKLDLETIVSRLSTVIEDRFKINFERLGEEFSRQIARLFEGGEASLLLVEDENSQYGIQIKLSSKGKRLSSLASLSGGERAMAGVALLAAILVVNPSPFVVLDEIDAALDDANSTRLAEIMEELAAKSQLIVITHNRQTMKAARVLFGVTMSPLHVSNLLSLHLEQATQMAAR
jgi:chromosome segregation ATPase